MKPISKKLLLLGCAALATSSMAVTAFAQPQVADFGWGTTIFLIPPRPTKAVGTIHPPYRIF